MGMKSCHCNPIPEELYWKKIRVSKGCVRGSLLRWRLLFLIIFTFSPKLWAQQYLTLGMGYGGAFWSSEDLNLFRETYNFVNAYYLAERMRGFSPAVGARWEIGYRYLGRYCAAVLIGSQSYSGKDVAQYTNGEARRLDLRMRSLFIECELGRTYEKLFISGVVTFYINRKMTLESVYSDVSSGESKKALDGIYEGAPSVSTDLGVALGYYKDPVIITCKITYPLFTGGGSSVLRDMGAEKVTQGTSVFPDDYEAYLYGMPYHGIRGDVDGLKILVTVAFAFQIKK